jgi:hypothetical protein
MEHKMFVVIHEGGCYGPFLDAEARMFSSPLKGARVVPLIVPSHPKETRNSAQAHPLREETFRARNDNVKIDTLMTLAGMAQEFFFARRENRVLTVGEINSLWDYIGRIHQAVESLMHYVELAVADPESQSINSLRKALWRNRDADDVDPNYRDRFW